MSALFGRQGTNEFARLIRNPGDRTSVPVNFFPKLGKPPGDRTSEEIQMAREFGEQLKGIRTPSLGTRQPNLLSTLGGTRTQSVFKRKLGR